MKSTATPDGYATITPSMNIQHADQAIEFYKRVFGAEERMRMPMPSGEIMRAEIMIGNSILMLGEAMRNPVSNLRAMIYVDDCDAVVERAVKAGATLVMPALDTIDGDRGARIRDPFGNLWFIATRKAEALPED